MTTEGDAAIGAWFLTNRKACRLSQLAVSEGMAALGCPLHQTAVSKIEKGKRTLTLEEALFFAAMTGSQLPSLPGREPEPLAEYAALARRIRLVGGAA